MGTQRTKGQPHNVAAQVEGNGTAGNPQEITAQLSENPQDATPAEVSEQYVGPYVPLALYFRHHRHWSKPLPNGEPLPIARQILELEREGIACLYDALNALVEGQYPHGSTMRRPTTAPNLGRWGDMQREHAEVKRAWAANNGTMNQGIGPRDASDPTPYIAPYGESYIRAREQLVRKIMVPHVVTGKEAKRHNATRRHHHPNDPDLFTPGMAVHKPDLTKSAKPKAEEIGQRWCKVYVEEIRYLLGDEPGEETFAAFARLHANLKDYQIGSKEGARVMERMKTEGRGAEALTAFARIRERLNELLDEVTEEHATPEQMDNDHRITWMGTKGELAAFIMELHDHKWIRKDGSWVKLAAKVHAVFQDTQGQPFDLHTLTQYVKPSGNYTTRKGVKFDVTDCPE